MLMTFILLLFARLQESLYENARAWQWALAYAVLSLAFSLMDGVGLFAAVIVAVFFGLYAWGYLALLRRVSDNLMLWLLVCLGGLVLPYLVLAKLLSVAADAA